MSATEPSRPLTTHAHLIGAAVVVYVLSLLYHGRAAWVVALTGAILELPIALCWLGSACGLGLTLLQGLGMKFRSGVLQVVVSIALGLGGMSLLLLGGGLAGIMSRSAAVLLIAVGIIACVVWGVKLAWGRPLAQPAPWSWFWLLPAIFLGIATACAFMPPGLLWGDEPHGYDVVEYHLQVPREWYEAGRIVPLQHNVFSYFPFNVEMHYLLAMLLRGGPWNGMYIAQLMHVCFIGMSVAAVFGVLAEMRSRYATIGALAMASVPWLTLLAPVAYNEGGLLLFGTLAIGLMLIADRNKSFTTFAVAGAMAGFACGTKLTAVPMILVAVPLSYILARVLYSASSGVGEGMGRASQSAVLFLIAGMITLSPWLIRNFAWTHNPVFPEATAIFGQAHFSDVQAERWRRAHSPRDDQTTLLPRVSEFSHQVLLDWKFGWLILRASLAAIILLIVENRRLEGVFLALLLLLIALIWIFFTHLQGRFFVLAIPIAAIAIGLVQHRLAAGILGGIVVINALISLVLINVKLAPLQAPMEFMGTDDLKLLTPLEKIDVHPDEHVVLVGDAKAFFYPIPMLRLRYRTIFDVHDWVEETDIMPGRTIMVVDPSEMRRLERTYWKVPAAPDEGFDEPFILSR